jgi:hypothetical protein
MSLGAALFVANLTLWLQDGYFSSASEDKPLLHLWSLSVEEQYYVFFPLLLVLAQRHLSKRNTIITLVVFASASLILAQITVIDDASTAFYFTPMRIWELLAGSTAAFLGDRFREKPWIANIGLIAIIIPLLTFSPRIPIPSIFTLIPVLGAVLVIVAGNYRSLTTRLLSTPPMVTIGLISYSTYLWHQPLFAFARLRTLDTPTPYLMAALSLGAFALGWLSWRYIERPFRQRTGLISIPRAPIFAASAGTIIAGTISGLLIMTTTPIAERENSNLRCNVNEMPCFSLPTPELKVVLWGDSYADAFIYSLGALLNDKNIELAPFIKYSCPPLLDVSIIPKNRNWPNFSETCRKHNERAAASIIDMQPDYIIMASSMYGYFYDKIRNDAPAMVDVTDPGASRHDFLPSVVTRTINRINQSGARLIFVTPHPINLNFNRDLKLAKFGDAKSLTADPRTMLEIIPLLHEGIARSSSINPIIIDGQKLLCGQG